MVTRNLSLVVTAFILFTSRVGVLADETSTREASLSKYLFELEHRIKQQWFPPKLPQCKTVIVRFQVHSDGQITDVVIEKASKSKLVAQAAVKAVKTANPAKSFPSGFPTKLKLRFKFDYYDDVHYAEPDVRLQRHMELINDNGAGGFTGPATPKSGTRS